MFDLLFERIALDPLWFAGSVILMVLMLILLMISWVRNARQLFWFYMVGLLTAVFYGAVLTWFPLFAQALVSYRSDWSLVFLIQNPSIAHFFTLLVFFFAVFALMGIVMLFVLELWSLLTFRWQRMKVLLERALSESWFVLVMSVLSVISVSLWYVVFSAIDFDILTRMFALYSFLFLLQFVFRMVDTAYLQSPKLLMEYLFSLTLMMVLARFVGEGIGLLSDQSFSVKVLFFDHAFIFFLCVLMTGFMASFFIRALFASTYFLEQHQRKTTLLVAWTSRILLSAKDRHYSHYRILMGVVAAFVLAFFFELLLIQEWYLTLIPAFFMAYFALFFILDRQDDMRVRGDLVDKRIESEVRKVFFS